MALILIDSITMFANFLRILLFARIILSFIAIGGGAGGITRFIYAITEPILAPIRGILARSPLGGAGMMVDFSPLVFFLLISLFESISRAVLIQFL